MTGIEEMLNGVAWTLIFAGFGYTTYVNKERLKDSRLLIEMRTDIKYIKEKIDKIEEKVYK